jgi:hypothetical protein
MYNILVLNVHESLRMRVTKVAPMWRSVVDFFLVERTRHAIGEDASRKARNEFDVVAVRRVKHVFIDQKIVPKEGQLEDEN